MYRGHPNITQTYSRVFKHMGASKHMGVSKHEGHPNIQVASKHRGHPNIQGMSTHMGALKCTGGHPNIQECPHIWGIWTPLSVTKHAFFVLFMYRGHPQHKESMLYQTKGVAICPIHLDTPISLDTPYV